MRGLEEKAKTAKEKKAALGPDIDLSTFTAEPVKHDALTDLAKLPDEDKLQMIKAGIDSRKRDDLAVTYRWTHPQFSRSPGSQGWR